MDVCDILYYENVVLWTSNLLEVDHFVFPFMSITMLKLFSNTFFLICMTSKLWYRKLFFQ
jgi:hypothetical protein